LGAAFAALLGLFPAAGACTTTRPDDGCDDVTTFTYIGMGAGIGALAGLVVGIGKER
jgi:hypothetical protein